MISPSHRPGSSKKFPTDKLALMMFQKIKYDIIILGTLEGQTYLIKQIGIERKCKWRFI